MLGDWVRTERPVTFTREDPAQGGPAAGLLAGLDAFARPPAWLVVLAVDMPRVSMATVGRLRGRGGGPRRGDALRRRRPPAAGVRASTRPGWAPYDRRTTRSTGCPLHRLLAPLDLVEVPALGDEARDVDGWADLRDLRQT